MLRIWDCFLVEGPKVLFRFTIALLGFYQDDIINHLDTISVIKVLKAAVRLTYDINGLIKVNFFLYFIKLKKKTFYLIDYSLRLKILNHFQIMLT